MKQSYTVPVRLNEELLRKLLYIAAAEGRSPAAHFSLMLRNNIAYFERAKGKIPADALRTIDIGEYAEKSDGE